MRISAVFSALLLIGTGIAQQTAPDSNVVIRSSTREVLLEVVVRDAHGKLITKIEPGQVAVYENGVRQEIRSFRLVQGSEVRAQDEKQVTETTSYETVPGSAPPRPPLSPLRTVNVVCLVLNDLTPDTRAYAFDAAKKFVNKELRPDTFIGVFTLDSSGLKPVFPFSNNREHLQKAVELAASKQLAPLNQSTAAVVNALNLSTMAQPMGYANLANQSTLNGMTTGILGAPVIIGLSDYGTSDGSGTQDPLGARGDMGVATQAGLREIDALTKLVKQLAPLPFQKTVLLMGTGLTRPPDQMEYWKSLISSANSGGVTFYAVDVYGLAVCQDTAQATPGSNNDCATATTASAASVALLQKSAALSQQESTVARNAGQAIPRPGGLGVDYAPSGTPQLMESMHQTDYARFAVLSANTQEALRDLADSTGGFLIANTNNSENLLARVMEDVDTHFEISYRPATDREDGHYRKIEVKLAWSDGRVQTRHGYFAVPESADNPLTPADLAGLQALDTKPLPHAFDFRSKAFRFRSEDGTSQYSIAFEVPISNLTATPDAAQKKQRFHASLLALVKNDKGEVVERISRDVPSEVPDSNVAALRSDFMTYEHTVSLAPGHYTIETAVVDQEGNRASTSVIPLDNRDQPGLQLSDIALVHIVQNLKRQPDPADPFEIPGKRASPFVSTALPAGADPFVYFVVYPEQNSGAAPSLGAQFLKDGRLLATQKSALPLPDEAGAIPMTIRAVREPGDYEVKITVEQGRSSVERSLKYTIAAK
ncbi:MAG: VWA domain-containing protein [Bryobacteraceae bacterium]|jgi:VWFA-related protein